MSVEIDEIQANTRKLDAETDLMRAQLNHSLVEQALIATKHKWYVPMIATTLGLTLVSSICALIASLWG